MLLHRKSVLTLGGLAVAGLLTLAGPGASAAGAGALVGTGTISPGLTTVPTNQTFTFGGTLAYAGSPGAGTYACGVNGFSTAPETVVSGGGNASGSCSGSAGTFTFSGTYTRNGGAVTVNGTASGSVAGHVQCALAFTATSAPPVVSYAVSGGCALT
jgi:hypothetical protein